jgi:hypothetical protein
MLITSSGFITHPIKLSPVINIILNNITTNNMNKIYRSLRTYIVNMNYDTFFDDFHNVIQITFNKGALFGLCW